MPFSNSIINFDSLRKKAFNNRWADLSDDIIPLTAADPDFPVAPEIITGINDYIKDGYLSYGPFTGLNEFKSSVASYFNKKHACHFSKEDVIPVNSAAKGMHLVADFLLKPGDEAIIFNPVDFLFQKTIDSIGAKVIPCSLLKDGSIDFKVLEKLISSNTKMISICNPHNPLGKVYSKEDLTRLSEISNNHKIWVMSDEIWSDIIYDNRKHISYSTISENAAKRSFTVYGFSKSFGLAGLRIGSVMCKNNEVMEDFIKKSNYYSTIEGVSTISQIAAVIAIEKAQYWLENFNKQLTINRNIAHQLINESDVLEAKLPEATYVVFPRIKNGMSSNEFIKQAMNIGKVSIVPGNERWFGSGSAGHVRICFSTSPEILIDGINRITSSFK